MNSPVPEDKLEQIKQALFQGRKIEAIKLFRQFTGSGLAEAKSAVDKLEEELRATAPDKFTASPERKGCLGVVVVVCLLAAIFIVWKLRF
jgi:hypothetical protein